MNGRLIEETKLLIDSGWRLLAFETFEEERGLEILRAVARQRNEGLSVWSIASGLDASGRGSGSLEEGLRAIAEVEEPALFVLLDARLGEGNEGAVRRLRDLLPEISARKQTVFLLGPVLDLPAQLIREVGHLSLPLPGTLELEELFAPLLSEDRSLLETCARAAQGLTRDEALRILRKSLAGSEHEREETAAIIIREKRQAIRRTPGLDFHDCAEGLDDVGGLGELKRWLRERRHAFGVEAERFGLPLPRGLLLLGVQGCGKSLSAKAVAREWQFPLLRLDLAAVFSGAETSPEAAIREATAVAESIAPAVLWIDEIEKGFAASGADVHTSRVFGSFLTWLAEKRAPVFVAATANDVANLPPELLRRGRFDELFFVDLPTHSERMEILSIHLRRHNRNPEQFDLEALTEASDRLSGAEIEQVVSAALYTAFGAGRELEDNDLANAIEETVPLYDTYEDRIKELRDWAQSRTRLASVDGRIADLFE
jgi:SpoVK/Ycf46/Vps4 family AAA+-type ATPase